MSKPATKQPPAIERRYLMQESACMDAVRELLERKGRPTTSGPEDAEERSKDDFSATYTIRPE